MVGIPQSVVKFIVIPFRSAPKGRIVAGEHREARNADAAERLASNMSGRFMGVAAYQMTIDTDTGEISAATLLARHGEIHDFLEDAV